MLNKHILSSYTDDVRVFAVELRDSDIACGRGKGFYNRPGNRVMLNLIHSRVEDYKSASKVGKGNILEDVRQECKSQGLRFVKRDGQQWILMNDKEAKEKIGHAMREAIGPSRRTKSKSNAHSIVRKATKTTKNASLRRAKSAPSSKEESTAFGDISPVGILPPHVIPSIPSKLTSRSASDSALAKQSTLSIKNLVEHDLMCQDLLSCEFQLSEEFCRGQGMQSAMPSGEFSTKRASSLSFLSDAEATQKNTAVSIVIDSDCVGKRDNAFGFMSEQDSFKRGSAISRKSSQRGSALSLMSGASLAWEDVTEANLDGVWQRMEPSQIFAS